MKKSLKDLYREYAILHCTSTLSGNYRKTNKAYDKINKIRKEIEKWDRNTIESFYSDLLNEENDYVKLFVASHCLKIGLNIENSQKILKKISKSKAIHPVIAFDAKMILKEYEKNGLKF